jgi:predicted transcriptional regulator
MEKTMGIYKMLMSINPEHVAKILCEKKSVEYRKTAPKRMVRSILIYSTSPVKRVVAEAELKGVIVGDVDDVWRLTEAYAGVSHNFYQQYFQYKKRAVAFKLGSVKAFEEPLKLSWYGLTHPTRNFCYLYFPYLEEASDDRLMF